MAKRQHRDLHDARRSKVGRLIETYGLEGLGAELERRWIGVVGDGESLRQLEDVFNRRLLRAALERAGRSPTDADVDATFRALTDDSNPQDRTRKQRELQRAGIDVDRLEDSFVTHQAIHTYLTDVRGVEYERPGFDVEDGRETIERLQGRTAAVTESTLQTLGNADEIAGTEYEALVDVRVLCRQCGRDFSLEDLLADRGCDCDD